MARATRPGHSCECALQLAWSLAFTLHGKKEKHLKKRRGKDGMSRLRRAACMSLESSREKLASHIYSWYISSLTHAGSIWPAGRTLANRWNTRRPWVQTKATICCVSWFHVRLADEMTHACISLLAASAPTRSIHRSYSGHINKGHCIVRRCFLERPACCSIAS